MTDRDRATMLNALSDAAGMAVATLEERERCMRIVLRWQRFCLTQGAAKEVNAVLAKVGAEISEGNPHDLTI